MWPILIRGLIAGVIVTAVIALSNRSPRLGAFVLTLPVVSILAILMTWHAQKDLNGISRLARETIIFVLLGLPFFVPLGFASRLGLGFWSAFLCGLALASTSIGLWLWLGPRNI